MAFYVPRPLGSRFTTILHSFAQDEGLPFATVLTEEDMQQAARDAGVAFGTGANDVYTPAVTLWGFLGQVLAGWKTCVNAVARIMVLRVALDLPPCSAGTGAYCKARAKLPEPFLRGLTYRAGTALEDEAPAEWRWHNRRVLLADGTTIDLVDTPANQAAYPQPRTQRPGLGTPILRLVVLLTFATAAVVGAAFGPYAGKGTGETALLRQLFEQLRAGDVLVGDRYYCSYMMIALLQQRGVDAAFRLHQLRRCDFRRGRRLGRQDHVVEWLRPARPAWMDRATYATIPQTLTIRELRFNIQQAGYRSRTITVATTLIDDRIYSKNDIADLYHQRWHAELDIRAIKRTLNMEMLRCQKPAMLRKELWAHLLGYNLVRKTAAQAALARGLQPRQLSFAAAVQFLEAFRWLLVCGTDEQRAIGYRMLFLAIAVHRVGDRPGRIEPRRLKRHQEDYPMMNEPRAEARARLRNAPE